MQGLNQTAWVIGATGFIGKFLTAQLLKENYQVFAMCRNLRQQEAQLRDWLNSYGADCTKLICIQGNVTQTDLGISEHDWQQLKNVDYLFNTAALFALVSVNMLVNSMIKASKDDQTTGQEILIASQEQICFQKLVEIISAQLQVNCPRHFISIQLLKYLLQWKWLAKKIDLSTEMLNFLRTETLDLNTFKQLDRTWNIPAIDLKKTIENTAIWVSQCQV